MNWYRKFIEAGKIQKDDNNFSWVRVDAPEKIIDIHTSVTNKVDEEDLYIIDQGGGDWNYGLEDDPHITVKLGLEFDEPDQVIEALKNKTGGNVSIEDIDIFDNDKYDVLVIKCKSKELSNIHKILTDDLKIEDDYPIYKPHITIGYFKKGKAKKYKDMALKAFTSNKLDFYFDEVIFEDRNDQDTIIKLDKE